MNNYDGPRTSEMDEFLRFLYEMSARRLLSDRDVYKALCFYNLKPGDKPVDQFGRNYMDGLSNEHFFKHWEKRFAKKKNINVFVDPAWSYFCQFTNNITHATRKFIKLYIPLDAEHLYDGANLIFEYLERKNISHLSKISKKLRVDNVIIRLKSDDIKSAQEIIDFINKRPFLKKGLNKTNPFIPTIGGIGYMQEHGNSYNTDISYYIAEYINMVRTRGINRVSAADFRDYLYDCKRRNIVFSEDYESFDDSLLDTFDIAYFGEQRSLNATEDTIGISDRDKHNLLINALKETYRRYGIEQVRRAILEAINNGNYSFITNGGTNLYRDRLQKNVTPNEFYSYISAIVNSRINMQGAKVSDVISAFCGILFENELPYILDEICSVTLENHGEYQVEAALNEFLRTGRTAYFSRFKNNDQETNYRDKLKMFDRKTFVDVLMTALSNKGVVLQDTSIEELCRVYASELARERGFAV